MGIVLDHRHRISKWLQLYWLQFKLFDPSLNRSTRCNLLNAIKYAVISFKGSMLTLNISWQIIQHLLKHISTILLQAVVMFPQIFTNHRKISKQRDCAEDLTTISPYLSNASLRSENVVVFSMFPTKRVLVQPGSKSSSITELACDERWRGAGWSLPS